MEVLARILLIDDEPGILENLRDFFEDEGFTVETAMTGEEGLEKLIGMAFPVALVDMRLPGIDGNEVIRRALAAGVNTRFLIHTGSNDYRLPVDLENSGLGPDNIFLKPIRDMALLVDAARRFSKN